MDLSLEWGICYILIRYWYCDNQNDSVKGFILSLPLKIGLSILNDMFSMQEKWLSGCRQNVFKICLYITKQIEAILSETSSATIMASGMQNAARILFRIFICYISVWLRIHLFSSQSLFIDCAKLSMIIMKILISIYIRMFRMQINISNLLMVSCCGKRE